MQERQFELDEVKRKKMRFMKEAKDHWDVTQKLKDERKRQKHIDDDVQNTLMFEDDSRFRRDKELQTMKRNKLRYDLKNQIREKRMEKRRAKDKEQKERTQILTGYPIGGGYVDRYKKLKQHHMDELRD